MVVLSRCATCFHIYYPMPDNERQKQMRFEGSKRLSQNILSCLPTERNMLRCSFLSRKMSTTKHAIFSKATSNDSDATEEPLNSSSTVESDSKVSKVKEDVTNAQSTAIFTGAVAILLGVGYLVLVQLLDSRSIVLVPPPPEALIP